MDNITQMMQDLMEGNLHRTPPMHLDNITACDDLCDKDHPKGEPTVSSKVRKSITLSDGSVVVLHGKTLDDAIRNALENAMPQRQTDAPLFKAYAKNWMDVYHDSMSGARWKEESRSLMKKHLLPYFGKMRLDQITVETVQRFYNSKKQYAASTIKHMKYLLKNILDSAVEDGILTANVVDSKRLSFSRKVTERVPLTEDQVADILRQISLLDTDTQRFILMLLFTGMRRGELLALRWEDIDLDHNVIHVRHSIEFIHESQPHMKEPKSAAGKRDIPISQELLPLLTPQGNPKHFIFGREDQPLTRSAYMWMFNKIKKTVDLHGATPHSFRHTFITAAAGRLDPKQLQEIAGHSKCDITMNRYAHTRYKNTEQTANDLAGLYANIGPDRSQEKAI